MGAQIRCEAGAPTPFMQWRRQELKFGAVAPSPPFPSPSPLPFLPALPSHVLSRSFHSLCHLSLPCSIPSLSRSSLLPSSSLPPHPSPLPFPIPSPSLPRSGPLNPARGSGERCKIPPAGSGAQPQPKSNLAHFSLKISHLVAIILIIFLRIN